MLTSFSVRYCVSSSTRGGCVVSCKVSPLVLKSRSLLVTMHCLCLFSPASLAVQCFSFSSFPLPLFASGDSARFFTLASEFSFRLLQSSMGRRKCVCKAGHCAVKAMVQVGRSWEARDDKSTSTTGSIPREASHSANELFLTLKPMGAGRQVGWGDEKSYKAKSGINMGYSLALHKTMTFCFSCLTIAVWLEQTKVPRGWRR